ncbi:hypothetical protein [Flavobacterium muglaense]|uniref:Uncharacterized protein n=1 Tax=Flavobacterium muglaense TaxID=2764716 RepID=A0A923MXE9_9FLAO|nr:hypothetical protein [Flavobacterium muglaense]MBC5836719.1 hypothetical protein [Flavobacterium muglaense]MBC5843331.1 hypothetical protein [Flavobacterium muglaense]
MDETYFESFLKLIDNNLILKKSTAIGVMVDLKYYLTEIKSEVLLELQTKGESKNDYLDYLINEVEKQDYVKEADISYIQKYLDQYNISISEIRDMKFMQNLIVSKIDRHYNDMVPFSHEKDEAFLIQTDFLNYFCKYYADELITFLKLKKTNNTTHKVPHPQITKPFKGDFLNAFIKEISNEREIYQSTFIQCYDFGIKAYTDYLKSEIKENLLILPAEKINPYLDFIEDKISSTPYFTTNPNIIDKWITKYNATTLEFPFLENKEINFFITKSINFHLWNDEDRSLMEDIQIDFYCYAAMVEAKKITDFLNSKKINQATMVNKVEISNNTENTNQLTVNQAVILLDKLGLFNSPKIENMPNTKKAILVSQLIGKNEKNIKTAIEKLELKQSELGAGYQRDLDKVQQLLNNLE